MNHTPPPWFAWRGVVAWLVFQDEGDNPSHVPIADCTGTQERPDAECEANAHLIAAAPEMKYALNIVAKEIIPRIAGRSFDADYYISLNLKVSECSAILASLAKAEGK